MRQILLSLRAFGTKSIRAIPPSSYPPVAWSRGRLQPRCLPFQQLSFAVKISLVIEITRGIVTPAYRNLAARRNEEPFKFVRTLNRSLTIFNLTSSAAVIIAFALHACWGGVLNGNDLTPLEQTLLRFGVALILSCYLPIIWVIWRVHTNLSHYIEALRETTENQE